MVVGLLAEHPLLHQALAVGPGGDGQLDANPEMLKLLDAIRLQASVRMGIAPDIEAARSISTVPYIGFVSPPAAAPTLSGELIAADAIDLTARIISNGQPHRALPLTGSLCTAVAARIAGSVVAECLPPGVADGPLRIGMPSGILTVGANVAQEDGAWVARSGSFYRTARRLFDGRVWISG